MATTVAAAELILQTRLRIGTGESAISDTNLFDVMDKTQKTINYALSRKMATGTLTVSSATTLYHTTTSIAADCLRVTTIYDNAAGGVTSARTIHFVPDWMMFQQYDQNWHKSTGSSAIAWAHVGHNMIACYPGSTISLKAVYVADSTTLNSSGDTFNLGDNDLAIVYDLCEIILLAHLRLYKECSNKVEQFQKEVLPYIEGGQWV